MSATVTSIKTVELRDLNPQLLVWRDGGKKKCSDEGRCRLCERWWEQRAPTRHHLVPQSWFVGRRFVIGSSRLGSKALDRYLVRDVDANIVPLCSPCHTAVENDGEARKMLRKRLGAAEATYVIAMRGREWFDLRYPATVHVLWRPDDDPDPEPPSRPLKVKMREVDWSNTDYQLDGAAA